MGVSLTSSSEDDIDGPCLTHVRYPRDKACFSFVLLERALLIYDSKYPYY